MRVCLFEDSTETLAPLSLTKPVFDLLCGMSSLGHKQLRHFGASSHGLLVRPALDALTRLHHPHAFINDSDWISVGSIVFVNGRWLPPMGRSTHRAGPCVGMLGDEVAFAAVGPDALRNLTPATFPDAVRHWQDSLPCRPAGGELLRYPWDLVHNNSAQLCHDFRAANLPSAVNENLTLIGSAERIHVDPSARIEPFVVADTTGGPVVIDRRAVVTAFTRLEGPCYIGPATQVHGAKIRAGTTLGPQCRIGGEVEASIVHGYTNKYHDGFLGHSYVGEWVNLGAGTHNSDLRNDYGEVSVIVEGQAVATGLSKVGCFLGDHTKTGLGTLLNTGTFVGAFCNILPAGRYAPKYVPSFMSWWNGRLQENGDLEQTLQTARTVMQRRGQELTEAHLDLYRQLDEDSAGERRRVMRECEQKALRRSA